MDYRIFIVRTGSFLCVRIHAGCWAHRQRQRASATFLTRKNSHSCDPDGVRTSGHRIHWILRPTLCQLSHPVPPMFHACVELDILCLTGCSVSFALCDIFSLIALYVTPSATSIFTLRGHSLVVVVVVVVYCIFCKHNSDNSLLSLFLLMYIVPISIQPLVSLLLMIL